MQNLNQTYLIQKVYYYLAFLLVSITQLAGQEKRPLEVEDYERWKSIENSAIAPNGEMVKYHEAPREGDETLKVTSSSGELLFTQPRVGQSDITWDSRFVIFSIKPAEDSIRELKRAKVVKEEGFPKDSLGIYDRTENEIIKFARIKDHKVPEEWSGYFAFRPEEIQAAEDTSTVEQDSTATTETKKNKKVSDKNGYHLVLYNLETGISDTFQYVTEYHFAKKSPGLLFHTTGRDSTVKEGVYHYSPGNEKLTALATGEHEYAGLTISMKGDQAAFMVDTDTTKAQIRNYQLRYWTADLDSAEVKADSSELKSGWIVNQHGRIYFSDDGSKLYFGTSPRPVVEDTTLLPDEKIQVEIWSYQDQRLMTQQNVQLSEDQKKSYEMVMFTENGKLVQLANEEVPDLDFTPKRNANYAMGSYQEKYLKSISWEGFPPRQDIFLVDLNTGEQELIVDSVRSYGSISPGANFIYWYNVVDTAWFAYDIADGQIRKLNASIPETVGEEGDDHPDYPYAYGLAGWTADDKSVLIYDRFDIWKVDPKDPSTAENLTSGRTKQMQYRYVDLDRDNPFINLKNMYLRAFHEETMLEGYFKLQAGKQPEELLFGDFAVSYPQKAKQDETVIYATYTNQDFPDLLVSGLDFRKPAQVSNLQRQHQGVRWSTVELVEWTSAQGKDLKGLLYKPEGFDPNKKYPMITYFYEINSDNLHRYWGAYPIRSIINPSYYASRGYLVFIPDIKYTIGYPGQSCYDAVIPGVTSLISRGFVDEENIGIQGHSWGGYQTAYLITRTDMFACAESGAPVSNMFSAYGGIRWGSGLSRMFQYEHTQSRIGGTIWEYPLRYLENSPIFFVDRINTPVLIMHNDEDTAVPWYQGIELFVGLRRLNKPAWMLNYNDEPHWPTKWENIIDFNIRMQQFFDHYLMDQPMPEWMGQGIPAIEKGINKGYELMEE